MLTLPHRTAHGLCIVNGIRDLVHWRSGRDWSNEFVYGLGQGSGFAYLRFNAATPLRQVYWGISTARQHEYLAGLLGAGYTIIENRSFKFAWNKAHEAVDALTPPVLGPLDMFYLPYYAHIYHQRHIPIHYILLVGYDDRTAYVHDTDKPGVQSIPLDELEPCWDVSLPAMGKRNRLVTFHLPALLSPDKELVRRSIAEKCRSMLYPPVSMLGIPAMKKLAADIVRWPEQLGEQVTAACLQQVREYLNTPPDITGDHLTATQDLYITFLQEAGPLAGLDFSGPIALLQQVLGLIPQLAHAIQSLELDRASVLISQIAEVETQAYLQLDQLLA
jgi:Butirosin biosynthesis protein H, N-terminal/Domain of unknown function (DUF4872)